VAGCIGHRPKPQPRPEPSVQAFAVIQQFAALAQIEAKLSDAELELASQISKIRDDTGRWPKKSEVAAAGIDFGILDEGAEAVLILHRKEGARRYRIAVGGGIGFLPDAETAKRRISEFLDASRAPSNPNDEARK
jgi:hypothetical protein